MMQIQSPSGAGTRFRQMKRSALRVVPPPARCVPSQAWRDGFMLIGERTLAEEVTVAFSYTARRMQS
jgi:hypothetical protein